MPVFITFIIGLLLGVALFPDYWNVQVSSAAVDIRTGITAEGHPWIGAEQPVIEIVEFTDYLCFQCKKMHYYLRELVSQHPDEVRLIHRNYPMDHQFNPIVREPFHEGSGKMAILAIHATAAGKFWKMNDTLFKQTESGRNIDLNETARQVDIDTQTLASALKYEPYLKHLLLDIRQGMKLGIIGTPSYLINGRIYEGVLPQEILSAIIDQTQKQ